MLQHPTCPSDIGVDGDWTDSGRKCVVWLTRPQVYGTLVVGNLMTLSRVYAGVDNTQSHNIMHVHDDLYTYSLTDSYIAVT